LNGGDPRLGHLGTVGTVVEALSLGLRPTLPAPAGSHLEGGQLLDQDWDEGVC